MKEFINSCKHVTLLVDASHLANRVFYANNYSTSNGHPTTILFGVIDNIRKFVRRFWQENGEDATCDVYIIWDAPGGSTMRKAVYPDYKANRKKSHEEATPEQQAENENKWDQIAETISVYKLLNFKSISFRGVEADDIIGIMSRLFEDSDRKVIILSSDRDMLQLITENIHVYRPIEDQYFDADNFVEAFGYEPSQHVFIKALVGKGADNVIGVKGVGAATAIKWLNEFGSIDGIIENLGKLTPSKRANMLALGDLRKKYYDDINGESSDDGKIALMKEQLMINIAVSRIATSLEDKLEVDATQLIHSLESIIGGSRILDKNVFIRIVKQYELESIAKNLNEFLEIFELELSNE